MGASFAWTFDQAFAGNTAPKLDQAVVVKRGRLSTRLSKRGTQTTEVSHR